MLRRCSGKNRQVFTLFRLVKIGPRRPVTSPKSSSTLNFLRFFGHLPHPTGSYFSYPKPSSYIYHTYLIAESYLVFYLVQVRILAVILCTTGIALLAYMEGLQVISVDFLVIQYDHLEPSKSKSV